MLVALLGLGSVASAQSLLVNEVLYDPAGTDGGYEWVELCNPGSSDVDVTGWEIESAGSSWSSSWAFSSGTVPAGGYLLVGYGSSTHSGTFSPNLQNGGSETDGVRLVNASGAVIDTLLYDSPNSNALDDDAASPGTSFAGDVSEDHTLARVPDCTDTDLSADDFDDVSKPTPGAANATTGDTGDTGLVCEDPGVLINELMPNPSGTDDYAEWVELVNVGSDPADLEGWQLQWGTSSFSTNDYTFQAGATISAGGVRLIGGTSVSGADDVITSKMSMGNASSSADAIRLVDCDGIVVDTVVYGEPNSDGFVDDSGSVATVMAPEPVEGDSLARCPDEPDTDLGTDFQVASATPGADNAACVTEECVVTPAFSGIKLNELVPDPEVDESVGEWVELYNGGSGEVDLLGWTVQAGKSSVSIQHTFEESLVMEPGDFLVLGESGVKEADVEVDVDLGNASSNADVVLIVDCAGNTIDTVVYGTPNEDGWKDDDGVVVPDKETSTAPGSGQSLARCEDGADTNQGSDFAVTDEVSPGSPNPDIAECDVVECVPTDAFVDVKINEFLPNPEGDDGGGEWLEIYNGGGESVQLGGWTIEAGTSSYSLQATVPGSLLIESGGFVLVGGEDVKGAEVEAELSMGAATNADAVRLKDCAGNVIDTVIYGEGNDDGWTDDSGAEPEETVSKPGEGESVARCEDGVDTDVATDFIVTADVTPGGPNPDCVPEVCEPGDGTIKLNELFPDPESTDSGFEWVEVFNTGAASWRLDGWTIEVASTEWDAKYRFPGGSEIGGGEYQYVGEEYVPGDYVADSLSLGNASAAPDGVRLVDCEGAVQDTVLYADEGDIPRDPIYDDADGVTMAVFPETGFSVGRYPNGVDTDDNAEDFTANMPPTPGQPNELPEVVGSGDMGGKKCGCDKSSGGADEGPKKCSTVDPTGGLGALVALFVGVRRRRR